MSKKLPFSDEQIRQLASSRETPFYLYDEVGIIESAKKLSNCFRWAPSYQNFFALKALPNPEIMKTLSGQGMGFDASSMAELVLCEMAGVSGENIIFTSNNTPLGEFKKCLGLGAILNLDDVSHLDYLTSNNMGIPELISFRVNPGDSRNFEGNEIVGSPREAKYGIMLDQVEDAYSKARSLGAKRFGIHTMVVSNELKTEAITETINMQFELSLRLKERLGIEVEFINLGGGFGIPYKPSERELDLSKISQQAEEAYGQSFASFKSKPKISTENGRFVTGPHGYLVTKVRHIKRTYKRFAGLDATMADLMRPGMSGAYHSISVLGKEDMPTRYVYDVTGSLCENNDKFAIDRELPKLEPEDIIIFHDVGAHAHAMGFNYNGKLRSAEYLLKADGEVKTIRRAETLDDYFSTLDF